MGKKINEVKIGIKDELKVTVKGGVPRPKPEKK